jgi:hypothetical protein
MKPTLVALRNGETVEVEGSLFKMAEGELQQGDWYIAERKSGPKLLTCESINNEQRWVVPKEPYAYLFDRWECIKVELVN